jgi:hypothetical protein
MLRMFLAGIGLLVDRHQPHKAHQPAYPVPPALVTLSLHISRHLTGPVPGRFQELFIPLGSMLRMRLPGSE